ncbi:MAG: M20/M25/M40 family metallo-hydrolase [Reichenbachiella sp.]|uniref:M20/M25/M40 family metallo-hydrolase n=1 Tax=Reichenbachiella sp. TaxID=2184521 RepID=UPI0032647ABF
MININHIYTSLLIGRLMLAGAHLHAQDTSLISRSYTHEASKTVKDKKVQKSFEIIDELESQTTKDLITLTEIPAPPFGEKERGLAFKVMLEQAGADKVWVDEVGNVLALREGTKGDRTIVLDAHIDTVFPIDTDLTVKIKGDTLIAPGIGDDTRGLVMVLTVLRAVNAAEIKTQADLLFVGTVGEEGLGDLRGVKHLLREGAELSVDSWISIDGGSLGRVNNGALGSTRYRAIFRGPGGHSWGAFGLANPHHALGKAIDYFTTSASQNIYEGPKTSYNIGRIGGGTSVNSIPFESWFEVDMRSLDPGRLLAIDSLFKTSVNQAVKYYNDSGVNGEIKLELQKIGDRPSGVQSKDVPLIQRALAATATLGTSPRLTTGSTNANIPIAKGIPAVTIGRGGRSGNAHSLDEWWANIDGASAIKLALLIAVLEAGLGK